MPESIPHGNRETRSRKDFERIFDAAITDFRQRLTGVDNAIAIRWRRGRENAENVAWKQLHQKKADNRFEEVNVRIHQVFETAWHEIRGIAAPRAIEVAESKMPPRLFRESPQESLATVISGTNGARDYSTGIARRNEKLFFNDEKMNLLGKGQYGAVYVHPVHEDAVLKLLNIQVDAMLFSSQSAQDVFQEDIRVTKKLAQAGAGPCLLGTVCIDGRPATVKERVFGDTAETLFFERRLTEDDVELIRQMLMKMAQTGYHLNDLRLPNMMLGTTHANPTRQAYLIDANDAPDFPPDMPVEDRFQILYHQVVPRKIRIDPYRGTIEGTGPSLSSLLQEGLDRANDKTWWQRFIRGFSDLLANADLGGGVAMGMK